MKIIRSINIDSKIYKEFQMYALIIGKSVSSLIEEHMKEVLKEQKKEG